MQIQNWSIDCSGRSWHLHSVSVTTSSPLFLIAKRKMSPLIWILLLAFVPNSSSEYNSFSLWPDMIYFLFYMFSFFLSSRMSNSFSFSVRDEKFFCCQISSFYIRHYNPHRIIASISTVRYSLALTFPLHLSAQVYLNSFKTITNIILDQSLPLTQGRMDRFLPF